MQHALLGAPLFLAIRGRGWIIIDMTRSAKRRWQNGLKDAAWSMKYLNSALKRFSSCLVVVGAYKRSVEGAMLLTHISWKKCKMWPYWWFEALPGWRMAWVMYSLLTHWKWNAICMLNSALYCGHFSFPSPQTFFPVCCCEFKHQWCSTHCCKGCINHHHYQIRSPHSTCERAKNLSRKKAAQKYYIFW